MGERSLLVALPNGVGEVIFFKFTIFLREVIGIKCISNELYHYGIWQLNLNNHIKDNVDRQSERNLPHSCIPLCPDVFACASSTLVASCTTYHILCTVTKNFHIFYPFFLVG